MLLNWNKQNIIVIWYKKRTLSVEASSAVSQLSSWEHNTAFPDLIQEALWDAWDITGCKGEKLHPTV